MGFFCERCGRRVRSIIFGSLCPPCWKGQHDVWPNERPGRIGGVSGS